MPLIQLIFMMYNLYTTMNKINKTHTKKTQLQFLEGGKNGHFKRNLFFKFILY